MKTTNNNYRKTRPRQRGITVNAYGIRESMSNWTPFYNYKAESLNYKFISTSFEMSKNRVCFEGHCYQVDLRHQPLQ